MRQRRRAERRFAARPASPAASSRRITERQLQRALYAAGAVLAAVLLGVLAAGWYFNSFQPPRKTVAEIDGREYRLGQLVPYTLLEGSITGTLQPETALSTLIRDGLLAAEAPALGAGVTVEDVEAELAIRFNADPPDPESDAPAQLSPDGAAALDALAGQLGVSVQDYREWAEGQLWQAAVFEQFLDEAPATAEQVFLEWIVAPDSVQAQAAFDRVAGGEEFAAVASELNVERAFADENGVVGWAPRGALPEIDALVFAEDLALGEIRGPVSSSVGSLIYRITDGPSEQPVDEIMRNLLARNAMQDWIDGKTASLRSYLTPGDVEWVIGRIR